MDSSLPRILIVDDEENVRHYLQLLLKREGYCIEVAPHADDAIKKINSFDPDLLLCDVRMPGDMDGLDLLDLLQQRAERCEVIMMSAYGSRDLALKAVQRGAYDYISKPIDREDLILTLHKLFERERLRRENRRLRAALDQTHHEDGIVASSKGMSEILNDARKVATFPTTVLIQGENGTGKELLARFIYRRSPRADAPFIPVNCGSIPGELFESQLFGHKRGAFTGAHEEHVGLFEEADGGTLFLDEIAELPQPLQVKLLRVLQENRIRRLGENVERNVDVRIIAATNRDLKQEVEAGRFREDLYYRLKVFMLSIPPLRERKEDIPALVEFYIEQFNARFGTSIEEVEPDVMRLFMQFSWDGNVRQLKHTIESAIILSDSHRLTVSSLSDELRTQSADTTHISDVDAVSIDTFSIKKATKELEIRLIHKALRETGGNRTAAAKLLELSHRALLYKIKEYGVEL